jgi:hypothetical protein
VSTFRRKLRVTLDGEPFDVTTTAQDHLKAEEAIGREKKTLETSPMALQLRLAFTAFNRCYPESPLARNWAKFVECFDDIDDLEAEPLALDPTQPEALDDWQ